jgi:hypothetical protein
MFNPHFSYAWLSTANDNAANAGHPMRDLIQMERIPQRVTTNDQDSKLEQAQAPPHIDSKSTWKAESCLHHVPFLETATREVKVKKHAQGLAGLVRMLCEQMPTSRST